MPSKNRRPVQLTVETHERLKAIQSQMEETYAAGRLRRQVRIVDGQNCLIPLHEVIRLLCDEYESHRNRSRKRKT